MTFNYIGQTGNYTLTGSTIKYIKVQLDYAVDHDVTFEHVWDNPEWTWEGNDEDGYTSATATFTCECGAIKTMTSEVVTTTKAPTHTEEGNITYTASVSIDGKTFSYEKVIHVPALKAGTTYRWELKGAELVSADGYEPNALLKKTGTINAETATFKNVLYQLTDSIQLNPDEEWSVEIKMTGKWSNGKTAAKILGNNGGSRKQDDAWLAVFSDGMASFCYCKADGGSHENKGVTLSSGGWDDTVHVFRFYC